MNDIVYEDTPKGFVSKNQLHAKNQRAHLKYLKKKKNKVNNATAQNELPEYNKISIKEVTESVVSTLQSDYKPKGEKHITDFKDIPLAKITILSYKKDCKMLSHIRYGKNIDGCILVDGTKVVGVISIEEKNNGQKWLQALEVTKPYRGYGLSKQLLYEAVVHYGARYLSVNKDNHVAISIYEKAGFEEYEHTDTMVFMKIEPSNIKPTNEYSLLEMVSKNAKPIFIVNSYTHTPAGRIIKAYTKSKYTHSAISLDTSLERLYSFNADNNSNVFGGVSLESLSSYINYYKDTLINVECIFVKESDYLIVKNTLDYMIKHQDNTTYGYMNYFNIIFGRVKEMGDNAMYMVCSQFVSYILSRADIKLMDKSANLTAPKDLVTTHNPRVYLLYDGLGREYDKKKIDRIFRKLKQKAVLIKECSL